MKDEQLPISGMENSKSATKNNTVINIYNKMNEKTHSRVKEENVVLKMKIIEKN